jgi:hypothetical protein
LGGAQTSERCSARPRRTVAAAPQSFERAKRDLYCFRELAHAATSLPDLWRPAIPLASQIATSPAEVARARQSFGFVFFTFNLIRSLRAK